MPRIARIVGPGYPHHVIQRGNNKQRVFFDDDDRHLYLKLLKKYSSECICKVHSYCLMDNHIHLLLTPKDKTSLYKTMQKLGLVFTQYINKKYKRTGRLWECRFHSSLIDKEKYLWRVCRYIERNPVRAKKVDDPVKYNWSSAKFNISLSQRDSFIESIWRYDTEREEYLKFLSRPDDIDEIDRIAKLTYKGMPIGEGDFFKYIAIKFGIIIKTKPRGRPIKKMGCVPN